MDMGFLLQARSVSVTDSHPSLSDSSIHQESPGRAWAVGCQGRKGFRVCKKSTPWKALNYTLVLISLGLHFSLFSPGSAFGINGPQLIGYSSESTALAGAASVAVADTSAINTNPAALSLIQGTRFDFTAGPLQAFLHHSDVFGNNNVAGENNVFVIGNAGFATRLTSVPGLTVGAEIFTQGGFGTEYQNLATAFGTRDDTSSFLRYFKFAIALSYEVTDKLSFGIAPNVGYSDVSLSLFPGTSVLPSAGRSDWVRRFRHTRPLRSERRAWRLERYLSLRCGLRGQGWSHVQAPSLADSRGHLHLTGEI